MGYPAAHSDREIDHKLLSSAMAYGTALGSFNVEDFGTARVRARDGAEISERVAELARITQFIERPVALKG